MISDPIVTIRCDGPEGAPRDACRAAVVVQLPSHGMSRDHAARWIAALNPGWHCTSARQCCPDCRPRA